MADFLENTDDVWGLPDPNAEAVTEEKTETVEAAPEAVEQEPEQPQEPEQEEQPPVEEKFNPTLYREMKEERAKRQAAERELEALRANQPKPQPQAPIQAPDPYEDPVGYDQHVQSILEQKAWQMRAEMSGRFAEQVHGREKVEAAIAWAQAEGSKDPTLGQRVQANADPVNYVVQEYERSRTLETLGGKSFEEAAQEYAKAQGWIVSQPGAEAPIQKPSPPAAPQGLARSPGKGGVGKVPQGADWGEVQFALDR